MTIQSSVNCIYQKGMEHTDASVLESAVIDSICL